MKQGVRYIVDVDIKGFFNHVDHEWLKRFLEHDIADPNFLRLIGRFLKGGVMEEGTYQATEEGTPQGGNLSPLLANVYLHYALDLWFEIEIKGKQCRGRAGMVRFMGTYGSVRGKGCNPGQESPPPTRLFGILAYLFGLFGQIRAYLSVRI